MKYLLAKYPSLDVALGTPIAVCLHLGLGQGDLFALLSGGRRLAHATLAHLLWLLLTVVALDAALGDELLVAGSTSVVRAGRVVLGVAIALLAWRDVMVLHVDRVVLVLG